MQEASDRLLGRSSDRHADCRRSGGLCFRLALRCAARRRCECDRKREHGHSASDRPRLRLAIAAHGLGTTRVSRRPGANTTHRRFNRITDQGVRIDIGLHAIGYTQCGDADHWSEQQSQGDLRIRRRREDAVLDATLHLCQRTTAHLGDERKALVLLAHPRDAAIEKHQREVLRMVLAEFVQTPRDGAHVIERIVAQVQQIRAERGLDEPAPYASASAGGR